MVLSVISFWVVTCLSHCFNPSIFPNQPWKMRKKMGSKDSKPSWEKYQKLWSWIRDFLILVSDWQFLRPVFLFSPHLRYTMLRCTVLAFLKCIFYLKSTFSYLTLIHCTQTLHTVLQTLRRQRPYFVLFFLLIHSVKLSLASSLH